MSNSGSGRRALKWFAMCAVLMAVCPSILQAKCKVGQTLEPGDHVYSIDFGGKSRTFTVHVPPKYDGKRAVPLVFDLHGFSSDGPSQLALSGFKSVADMNDFIVVAPTGYMNSWNGDIAFGAAYEAKLDDVGLMKAIVQYIAGIANINRGKVYSTGLSNGAAMSNTLGCQATDTFAAVAPVADPLDIGLATCMPTQPISVLGFHGYSDQYVPYEGGAGSGPRLPAPFPSIPDTLKNWAKVMQCTGTPELVTIRGENKCEIYRACGGGAEVGYCSLEGSHVLYQQNVLDIADYAWKFFDKFSLPLPDADGDHIGDEDDNCVHVANPDQADANGNCVGDACECSTPADCDDGMFCNGSETCTSGVCGQGVAACQAAQTCDESGRRCAEASTKPEPGATAGSSAASAGKGGQTSSGAEGTGTITGAVSAGSSALSGANPAAGSGAGGVTAGAAASGSAAPQVAAEPRKSSGCDALGVRGSQPNLPAELALALLGVTVLRVRRPVTRRRVQTLVG